MDRRENLPQHWRVLRYRTTNAADRSRSSRDHLPHRNPWFPGRTSSLTHMNDAFIIDAIPRPSGSFGGTLLIPPDDLATHVLRELILTSRTGPAAVDDVIVGCADQTGQKQPQRGPMALLLAGLPVNVPETVEPPLRLGHEPW